MSNGAFVFKLSERQDKDQKTYLFAGLTFLNMVLFVRPDPDDPFTWHGELKPYVKEQKLRDDIPAAKQTKNTKETR